LAQLCREQRRFGEVVISLDNDGFHGRVINHSLEQHSQIILNGFAVVITPDGVVKGIANNMKLPDVLRVQFVQPTEGIESVILAVDEEVRDN